MSQERVMLLIDADNVSVDVMEQAIEALLADYGALHVRRAYCTAESAVKHQAVFKRLSIKPMVNLAAGKNSTDIALAVDALDLVLAERPDVVVIASSDSDFAPLVSRLREKGCRVRGIGQQGKTGDETQGVYDEFTVIAHRRGAAARRKAAPSRSERQLAAPPPQQAPAPPPPSAPQATPARSAPQATPARSAPQARAAGRKSPPARPPESQTAEAAPAVTPPAAEAPARKAGSRRSTARKGVAAPAPDAAAAATADAVAALLEAAGAGPAQPTPPKPAARKSAGRKAAVNTEKAAPASRGRKAARKAAPAAPAAAPAAADTAPPEVAADLPAPAPQAAQDPQAPARQPPREVAELMAALPALAAGERVEMQRAAEQWRRERLLSRRSSVPRLLGRFPDWFELEPPAAPKWVRARVPAGEPAGDE